MITDIKEFGANLGNREYWDCCGAEWNHTTIEQKIFKLAEFVQAGGNLYPVIYKYAKGREYTYRRAINWCILDYLNTLMVEGYYVNFMLLDNKEAVKLLTELLKVGAELKFKSKRIDTRYYDYYEWELKRVEDESILVAIEEEHKQKYPDETLDDQKKLIRKWKDGCWWRK
ncbi:MAG: hypothetical protein II815_05780 [Bacteroidales bacterium]|nr:hypothetical protein [Bacteroidales bacterium]